MPADRETAGKKCMEVLHFLLHKFTHVNILLHLFYLTLCSCIVYLSFWMLKIKLQDIYMCSCVCTYVCMYIHTHIFTKTHAYKNKVNEHRQEINLDVKPHWILLLLVPVMEKEYLPGSRPSLRRLSGMSYTISAVGINQQQFLTFCVSVFKEFLIMCILVYLYGGVDVSPVSTNARRGCQIPWICSYRWLSTAIYGRWVLN